MESKHNPISANPIAVGFILLSIIVIAIARGFPDRGQVGAGFFPIVLSAGIIVFSIAVIVAEEEVEPGFDMDWSELKPVLIVLGIIIAYIATVPVIGFLLGTTLFLIALSYYSGVTSKPVLVSFSVAASMFLYYLFDVIFLIRLPKGVIPISNLLPPLPLVVI